MSDSFIESSSEDESLAIKWALMSEAEGMPPKMQEDVKGEEEGNSTEVDDEREGADVDVVAESGQRVPARFSKEELTIMMNAKPQWMSARWAVRKKILETVYGQLYKLDACKGLDNET
ncbi:hypothetical protein PAXRUDRAFT_14296 [Paxillus rubicundulus Ve08.2h10]|uniref:Uncharacterized protein n=1 Tax=Paxillus rubicundulus Ve08.2h10 TaxID=930991 RepID=A0A0D0DWN5_9AGAM|nr:hypothetical protein PAXRUDRAFT_14296 [Paxillus rubicundulus Ve08.2h10]